jgi:hypothetical protein
MTNTQLIINEAINTEIYTEESMKEFIEKNSMLPLNTFLGWKSLGYTVKKGEKAMIKTKLWKFTNYKKRKLTEEFNDMSKIMEISKDIEVPEKPNHYYLTNATLFDISQVEKIA